VKVTLSPSSKTDDVTSDFDNIVANAKDSGILFVLLLHEGGMKSEAGMK